MYKLFSQHHSVLWTIRSYSTAVVRLRVEQRSLSCCLLQQAPFQEGHLPFAEDTFWCVSAWQLVHFSGLAPFESRIKFSVSIACNDESNPASWELSPCPVALHLMDQTRSCFSPISFPATQSWTRNSTVLVLTRSIGWGNTAQGTGVVTFLGSSHTVLIFIAYLSASRQHLPSPDGESRWHGRHIHGCDCSSFPYQVPAAVL